MNLIANLVSFKRNRIVWTAFTELGMSNFIRDVMIVYSRIAWNAMALFNFVMSVRLDTFRSMENVYFALKTVTYAKKTETAHAIMINVKLDSPKLIMWLALSAFQVVENVWLTISTYAFNALLMHSKTAQKIVKIALKVAKLALPHQNAWHAQSAIGLKKIFAI